MVWKSWKFCLSNLNMNAIYSTLTAEVYIKLLIKSHFYTDKPCLLLLLFLDLSILELLKKLKAKKVYYHISFVNFSINFLITSTSQNMQRKKNWICRRETYSNDHTNDLKEIIVLRPEKKKKKKERYVACGLKSSQPCYNFPTSAKKTPQHQQYISLRIIWNLYILLIKSESTTVKVVKSN